MASVQIVAEIGTCWHPDKIDSAIEMIGLASTLGIDAVKFQYLDIERMNRPDWWKDKTRAWHVTDLFMGGLRDAADAIGLKFFFSVFTLYGVEVAVKLQRDTIKIAASEIGNQQLLRWINKKSNLNNLYLSVDYRKIGAVVPALTWLPDCAVTLLYCVSDYPAELPPADLFDDLKDYGLPVGWSSHVPFPEAVTAAEFFAKNGATVIEAHLRTKDTPKNAPDNGPWALYPEEFTELVKAVRDV